MELEGDKELLLYMWLISIEYTDNVVKDIRSTPCLKMEKA